MSDALITGLVLIVAILSFLGMCLWVYSGRNKSRYEEAANIPFLDETEEEKR